MKLIEAKAVVEYKAPQQGALMMLVPAMRVMKCKVKLVACHIVTKHIAISYSPIGTGYYEVLKRRLCWRKRGES
jgi:hypothetical protein